MVEHPPLTPVDLQALKDHYEAIREISEKHGISVKGSICTWYPYSDDKLVVEADGIGGAELMLVSDHYPFDGFDLRHTEHFADEHEACRAAEWFDEELEERGSTMSASAFFRLIRSAEKGKEPWNVDADDNSDEPGTTAESEDVQK